MTIRMCLKGEWFNQLKIQPRFYKRKIVRLAALSGMVGPIWQHVISDIGQLKD